jgi:hypothetical protein
LQQAPLGSGPLESFSAPVVVLRDSPSNGGELVLGPDRRLAVLTNYAPSAESLFALLSEDGGSTFTTPVLVDPNIFAAHGLFDGRGRFLAFYTTNADMGWNANVRAFDPGSSSFAAPATAMRAGMGVFGKVFATGSDEISIVSASPPFTSGPPTLALERFVPSSDTWGDRTVLATSYRCVLVAPLEGGRLALVVRPMDPAIKAYLTISADGGRSFGPRQQLPDSLYQDFTRDLYCASVTTDGRALYFTSWHTDHTIGFLRAAQPGTTCP